MKRRLSLYVFCCLALSGCLTACSEDLSGNAAPSGDNRVSIASATVGTATRAAADATEFQINDMISLSADADGTNAATYTFQGADGWNSTDPLAWGNTFPVTYYAAYPATATYNDFTLPTDQSLGTADANYMTAHAEVSEKKALSLAFAHKTAQVIVKITSRATSNGGTLTDAIIRSPHSEYTDETATGDAIDITPQTASETATGEEPHYTALVLPGTADGFKLFSVNVGDKEVSFTTDIAFEENRIYEYTLTIGTDRVTLAGFTAKEWTENSLTADMTSQWDGQVADGYAGGDGSNSDPYQIATPGQLARFAKEVNDGAINNKYLKLTANIDLGDSNWTPIGNEDHRFYGHFDGQGHTIRNLSINQSKITDDHIWQIVGLFGGVGENTSIRNLTVENAVINIATIENQYTIGVIAGNIDAPHDNAIIDNCHVAGANITYEETSNYNTAIGGIAGYARTNSFPKSITFSRCTVDNINVRSNSESGDMAAGGILGWVDGGQTRIYACSASGTLTGRNTCGLVGVCYNGSLLAASGCYVNCTLNGNTSAAISILSEITAYPIIQWSYLAGLQSDALREGVEPNRNNSKYPTKEDECYLVTDHSAVYGIVANPANETTFTVDGTIYYVRDCWKNNSTGLPTLKVNKDGTTTE